MLHVPHEQHLCSRYPGTLSPAEQAASNHQHAKLQQRSLDCQAIMCVACVAIYILCCLNSIRETVCDASHQLELCAEAAQISWRVCWCDAGYTMTAKARSRSPSPPDDATAATAGAQQQQQQQPDRVQQQLDALGDCHIGYSHMRLPDSNISIVGARPFSKVGHLQHSCAVRQPEHCFLSDAAVAQIACQVHQCWQFI
jgi:hypothetical protein